MNAFHCDACGALVFFESVTCLQCSHALGFLPDRMDMSALEPEDDAGWRPFGVEAGADRYRSCANGVEHAVCNWLVPAGDANERCAACRMNEMIPDVSVPANLERWHRVEIAKRRLVYTLRRLGLPTDGDAAGARPALRFRFLVDLPGAPHVVTGHENGVVTLNLAEADDAERERLRVQFFEPQRTLVGHLRHESGHYYWEALIAGTEWQEPVRALFGDEQVSYADALASYYAGGPAPDWPEACVSAYASAHPWEDWAETWAHYLHVVDALETAAAFGLSVRPRLPAAEQLTAEAEKALAPGATFDTMIAQWFPLTYALNSLNRGIGLPDLYPYVLSARAIDKLRLVHDVIAAGPRPESPP